jgi:endogenous inhibitor of DNA gyrase (YacG/DUF329 family)
MAPTVLPCPTCKREVTWGPEAPFRPFCSERCKLIDLGAWFSGERAIAGDATLPEDAGLEDPGDAPIEAPPRGRGPN